MKDSFLYHLFPRWADSVSPRGDSGRLWTKLCWQGLRDNLFKYWQNEIVIWMECSGMGYIQESLYPYWCPIVDWEHKTELRNISIKLNCGELPRSRTDVEQGRPEAWDRPGGGHRWVPPYKGGAHNRACRQQCHYKKHALLTRRNPDGLPWQLLVYNPIFLGSNRPKFKGEGTECNRLGTHSERVVPGDYMPRTDGMDNVQLNYHIALCHMPIRYKQTTENTWHNVHNSDEVIGLWFGPSRESAARKTGRATNGPGLWSGSPRQSPPVYVFFFFPETARLGNTNLTS